ncbi:MAG: DOMON-like domain-containing protein [Novosphingobium sp.]
MPHPDHPPLAVRGVVAQWISGGEGVHLRYRVEGHGALVVPPFAGMGRADGLWRTTCFELFLRRAGEAGYVEMNFSPSRRWAAYAFADTRADMREWPLEREPVCESFAGERSFVLDVRLPRLSLPPRPLSVGLSAVIEETGGVKSYWALAHPTGQPDFHHPACFALALEPPAAI